MSAVCLYKDQVRLYLDSTWQLLRCARKSLRVFLLVRRMDWGNRVVHLESQEMRLVSFTVLNFRCNLKGWRYIFYFWWIFMLFGVADWNFVNFCLYPCVILTNSFSYLMLTKFPVLFCTSILGYLKSLFSYQGFYVIELLNFDDNGGASDYFSMPMVKHSLRSNI